MRAICNSHAIYSNKEKKNGGYYFTREMQNKMKIMVQFFIHLPFFILFPCLLI